MNVQRSDIRRWALAIACGSLGVAHSPAHAGTVTIDWVAASTPVQATSMCSSTAITLSCTSRTSYRSTPPTAASGPTAPRRPFKDTSLVFP